jgi:Ni/Co efflux regulator RcnB
MKRVPLSTGTALAVAIAGALAIGPALADKPSWAGEGKGGNYQHQQNPDRKHTEHRDGDEGSPRHGTESAVRTSEYFDGRHRTIAHDYYGEQFRGGHCPPGLAKKNNGCMPPGQARNWTIGRPLPREVIYYELPPALVVQFGRPPAGYRYVRVASDILLIALGTGMIVDAIQDLGRS